MGSMAAGTLGSDLTLVVLFRRAPYAGQCKTDPQPMTVPNTMTTEQSP